MLVVGSTGLGLWYGLGHETGVDYLRRKAPMFHIIDLEERAHASNAKIDAGAWDELGLGG